VLRVDVRNSATDGGARHAGEQSHASQPTPAEFDGLRCGPQSTRAVIERMLRLHDLSTSRTGGRNPIVAAERAYSFGGASARAATSI
jgi:hypothetical protein